MVQGEVQAEIQGEIAEIQPDPAAAGHLAVRATDRRWPDTAHEAKDRESERIGGDRVGAG